MKELIIMRIFQICLEKSDINGLCMFCEYAGHTNALVVRVFLNGCKPMIGYDFRYDIYLTSGDDLVIKELKECLETLEKLVQTADESKEEK